MLQGATDPSAVKDNTAQASENSKCMEQSTTNIEVKKEPQPAADPDNEIEQVQEAVPGTKIEQKRNAEERKNINLRAESFVAPEDWQPDGVIIGDKENKLLISSGDTVYVSIDPDKVKPGMICNIYRKLDKIKDQTTKEFAGYEIRRIGNLQFTDKIGKKVSSAVITTSYDTVEVDDIVKFEE